jgi:mannose-6-phosphate isomerase
MKDKLYPLKFYPILKEKIWGGRKLESLLNKKLSPQGSFGESWEISGLEDNISVVSNGHLEGKNLIQLIEMFSSDLMGKSNFHQFGKNFPLLIKFLDAQKDLSVQVHPDNKLAKKRGYPNGKTEMWFVLQSDPDSYLNKGFNKKIDLTEYKQRLKDGSLFEILNSEKVSAGDVFYIPSGTIHNIGKGILLTEIQQSSDVTYRINDFDRTLNGQKRELHLTESEEALNFEKEEIFNSVYQDQINTAVKLVESPYFTTRKFKCDQRITFAYPEDSGFKIFICVNGKSTIKGNFEDVLMKKGDCILIPEIIRSFTIESDPEVEILECQIPAIE